MSNACAAAAAADDDDDTCIAVLLLSNSNSRDSVYCAAIVAVHCHCESSPGSSDECSTQRQVAADLWTKPISPSQQIRL